MISILYGARQEFDIFVKKGACFILMVAISIKKYYNVMLILLQSVKLYENKAPAKILTRGYPETISEWSSFF